MAITTLDGLIAALPGQLLPFYKVSIASANGLPFSLWTVTGLPGAGAIPTSGAGDVPTSASAGALPFTNPTSPALSYLARFAVSVANAAALVLYDRLVETSGLSGIVATAQTVNSVAITRPDANGADVELWLEVYTATGATAANVTASYTNQAGVSGRTTVSVAFPTANTLSRMIQLPLQAGDTGVRSVQSVTLSVSTGTAGNFGVTLLRRLQLLPLGTNTGAALSAIGAGLPQIPDNACLAFLVLPSTTTTSLLMGELQLAQG